MCYLKKKDTPARTHRRAGIPMDEPITRDVFPAGKKKLKITNFSFINVRL